MAKKAIKRPLDIIAGNLKKSAWAAVLESIVLLIFGILLVAWPGITYYICSIVLGVILIIVGLYQIVTYFIVKGQNNFFDNSLLFGVVSIIIGIAAVCFAEETFTIFRIIMGIWLIFESLVRVNTTIKLHAAGLSVWGWVLAIALIMLAAGIFVLFNTTLVIQVVGGLLILAGVVGVVGDIVFVGQVDAVAKSLKE